MHESETGNFDGLENLSIVTDDDVRAREDAKEQMEAMGLATVEYLTTDQVKLLKADIVTLHMNLTPENHYFINRDRLRLMKPTAYLINCARGGLVNTADLLEALRNGRIAGYAADVLEHEPPEPHDPLIASGLENVILTPHIGSRTYESVVRQATMAVKNLVAVLSGDRPLAQAN